MTVRELQKVLSNLPPDMEVMLGASEFDHSTRTSQVRCERLVHAAALYVREDIDAYCYRPASKQDDDVELILLLNGEP